MLSKSFSFLPKTFLVNMAPELVIPTTRNAAEIAGAIQSENPLNCAYVTFLAGAGDYVKGVVCLAKGLRKVKAAYPLVVAVLPDVPEEHRSLLLNQGCLVREIEPVCPPAGNNGESPFVRPYFAVNYCKLRLWEVSLFSGDCYLSLF